jgi:thiol-disulfide isomerase/thioredoxin
MTLFFFLPLHFVYHTLRLLCSLLFLISASSKLYPIEYFENQLIQHHLAINGLVEIQARLLVSVEFFLGLVLIWTAFTNWAAKWSFALLSLFNVWLLWLIIVEPEATSCGCFGKWVEISPWHALLKNVLLQIILVLLWNKTQKKILKHSRLVLSFSVLLAICTPFIVSPPIYTEPLVFEEGKLPQAPFTTYGADASFIEDCMNGTRTVAIFLSSCEHCKMTANRLQALVNANGQLQVRAFIVGDAASSKAFMEEAKAQFPYRNVEDLGLVVKSVGNQFPIVLVVNNGQVLKSLAYFSLSEEELLLTEH